MSFFSFKVNPSTLSSKLNIAWNNYKSYFSAQSKDQALNFLRDTLQISRRQPKEIILTKIEYLMLLKKNNSDPNYIPQVSELPKDENVNALGRMKYIGGICKGHARKIKRKSFHSDNTVNAFIEETYRAIENIQVLEEMEQLKVTLAILSYGIATDPLVAALQQKVNQKIATAKEAGQNQTIVNNLEMLLTLLAIELIEDIPIETRANHYRQSIDLQAYFDTFDERCVEIESFNRRPRP